MRLVIQKKRRLLTFALLLSLVGISAGGFASSTAETETPGYATKIPVLCYHHLVSDFGNRWQNNNSVVTITEFAQQMAYLEAEGYHAITLDELNAFIGGVAQLPAKSVLITFDDGYASNYWYAYPILKRHNLKAVVFVLGSMIKPDLPVAPAVLSEKKTEAQTDMERPTGQLPTQDVFAGLNPAPDYDYRVLDFMTWGQLKELSQSGIITLADHTWAAHSVGETALPAYQKLSKSAIMQDRQRLRDEFARQKLTLVPAFAYPHGYHGKAARDAVAASGMRFAFTLKASYVVPGCDPLRIPRLVVSPGLDEQGFAVLLQGL